MLIQEIHRRVACLDVWGAIYTADGDHPTSIATANTWHRQLNSKKLVDVGFAAVPCDGSLSQLIQSNKLTKEGLLPGFRLMTKDDVPQVTQLLKAHLTEHYKLHINYDEE